MNVYSLINCRDKFLEQGLGELAMGGRREVIEELFSFFSFLFNLTCGSEVPLRLPQSPGANSSEILAHNEFHQR